MRWSPALPTLAVALALGASPLAGCGDNDWPVPRHTAPDPPAAPDPTVKIVGLRSWYLVGDGLTPGDDQLTMIVTAPAGTQFVDAWIGNRAGFRLQPQNGQFAAQVSIADLPAGTHALTLAADGSPTAFAQVELRRSAPLYLLMSTDWDFSDPGDQALALQDQLHQHHPGVRITNFVGPYTFTDPAVAPARVDAIVTWLLKERDINHGELALHIHPYCNFVVSAGLTCITDQSTVYATDATGYTIKVAAYGRTDFGKLLDHAATLFQAHGLGTPTTFRAGGWTASAETFQALADKGYVADTSALNWARLFAWIHIGTGELYRWNQAHWARINDTSQPYYPNHDQPTGTAAPRLPLLEVPDNGIMVDYITKAEMIKVVDENWDGGPLTSPRTAMFGFHPSTNFSVSEYDDLDGLLSYADMHLAVADRGPIVYAVLRDLPRAFPSPP
jgi:hypothetical protein